MVTKLSINLSTSVLVFLLLRIKNINGCTDSRASYQALLILTIKGESDDHYEEVNMVCM